MSLPLLLLTLALAVNGHAVDNRKLTEVFRWKELDFQFPNSSIRDHLLNTNRYIPAYNNPSGIAVWRNKLFITVPRWFNATGSTLNYVDLDSGVSSPKLIPYPNYDMNDVYNGDLDNKLISTTRIFVDSCNRLWVPDNSQEGRFFRNMKQLASRKLFIFDLNTNRVLRNVLIGKEVTNDETWFHEIVVDITNEDCNKAFAYIADTLGYGLLVYSWETNTLRRITNAYFFFEPQSSSFPPVQFLDGLIGLSLSGVNRDGYKTLYFHSLSSYYEYNVSTRVLQDPNLSLDFTNFKLLGYRGRNGRSNCQRFDEKTGVLIYTQVDKNGIACWNPRRSRNVYSPSTQDMAVVDQRLSFPAVMSLDRNRNLWVLSNKLLSFALRTLDPQAFTSRVFYAPVDKLIDDTFCKARN